jgi:NAD(P)-dependent dehydrogenase (short-subunit alcohol dehydrogenase family)
MGNAYSQFFPPQPTLTEANLSSQHGKVFIVTGGASGIGFELVRILYHAGGTVYIGGRNEKKALQAIDAIKDSTPAGVSDDTKPGRMEFLQLDLDDLSSIRATAQNFMSRESRLDVLWNNAGISAPPLGSLSKQGHDLQLATNCLGPYLLTRLLLPMLKATTKLAAPYSVRIVWAASFMVDWAAPPGGMIMDALDRPRSKTSTNYVVSKTGNWFLASEFAHELGKDGIISIAHNPGSLNTDIFRNLPWMRLLGRPILYEAKYGAYTELWAGLSEKVGMADNGGYVIPWGRMHTAPRLDLLDALKSEDEGGTGRAKEFRDWCEKHTERFAIG